MNLTVFGIFESVFIRGFTAEAPDRTLQVWLGGSNRASDPNFRDVAEATAVEKLAGYTVAEFSLGEGDRREKIFGQSIAGDYFELPGVRPALGRTFSDGEKRPENAAQVAILSNALFERCFDGNPAALGQNLRLNGKPFTVIGVLPKDYRSVHGFAIDPYYLDRTGHPLELLARVAPAQSREAASTAPSS